MRCYSGFVVIPAGTVLLEEIAFRSVLWGMLSRHFRTWQVLGDDVGAVRPVAHPSLAAARGPEPRDLRSRRTVEHATLVVAGAVAVTTIGGLVFGELRRRSGSVLASAGAHWATNALGVLVGLIAWHLADETAAPASAP